jgi:signal transduction histidine kinase
MTELNSAPIQPDSKHMEALAEFAAGAGHEINNPLATILGRVQQLMVGETDPQKRAALQSISSQALRIRDMITDVMLFARPPAGNLCTIEPQSLISEVLEKIQSTADLKQVQLQSECGHGPDMLADPDQFQTVISELVRNALAVSPNGSVIHVNSVYLPREKQWQIQIIDHGPGLSDEEATHMFTPFYSGRQAGRGHGFGLCKCWTILQQHQGQITISTKSGQTTAETRWPLDPNRVSM